MTKFLIGCDPEVFVKDESGKVISAHDLIPGSKKAPHKIDGGAVQPDGLAAEFNIDPVAATDFTAFNDGITKVLTGLKDLLPKGSSFAPLASTTFDAEYYEALPETAKELGCEPDFCAYSDDPTQPNPRPDGASGLRSAAGHIHIGWGADIPADHPDHIAICRQLVKQLDCYVGLGMTVFDTDTERRKLYGKAGAYRPKSYGVEYRTPSNAWLFSRNRRSFIHGLVNSALTDMQNSNGNPRYEKLQTGGYDVAAIINNGDAAAARAVLSKIIGVFIPEKL